MKRYEEIASGIAGQIDSGVLGPGERLFSVRKSSRIHTVSPGTILQAYHLLEHRGLVESRSRSGFYVTANWKDLQRPPERSRPSNRAQEVNVSDLVFEILESVKTRNVVPLGSAFVSPLLFPLAKLGRFFASSTRHLDPWSMVEHLPPGDRELRRQIARRYLESDTKVALDEIVVTTGALEALNLSLATVTRPGDVLAVESPAFYAALQAAERLNLRVVEIPTHSQEGLDLDALAQAIRSHGIKACWLMTNFQNPLGASMPEEKKKALVRLLAKHGIPLIEDDVYEELYFDSRRPGSAKTYDRSGLVLHCSSFSKCLGPGYRVGWVAAGRYAREVNRLKWMTTLTTNMPGQLAISAYLKHGGYDQHLHALRHALRSSQIRMVRAIRENFPVGTQVSVPRGGYFLWVEMPKKVNALDVYRAAKEKGISVAPGPMFSPRRKCRNCIRLNYGHPWSPQMDAAMTVLGRIVTSLT